MSSLELQQARGGRQALAPEPQHKTPSVSRDANVASKPPSKQKGIFGMFASKAASKTRDVKEEQEEAAQVWTCVIIGLQTLGGTVLFNNGFFFKLTFQVDPVQSKPAGKADPMANFFRVQTSSEYS